MGNDEEEMMMSWCFKKELIENSPSRRDGISAALEAETRSQYCHFIRWMCTQFKLDAIPTMTALIFCHRFYALQSLAKNDWKTIATACVFLSAKSEDSFRSLDNIVKIAFSADVQKLPTDLQKKVFLQKQRQLIEMAENLVLVNLRFNTNVNHPYRLLHDGMKLLHINSKELRRELWKLVGCWLESTLCLEHRPELIAAASLHILGKLYDLRLTDVRDLSLWSEKIASDKWDECLRQMVQILCMQNWPRCARLMDSPALPQHKLVPKPKPEPETKAKQATSIQKLPELELGPNETKSKVVTPDSVLDLAEEASKMLEAIPKRETIILHHSNFSVPEQKATDSVLDFAEEASKMLEAIPKRETIILDHSHFSVPEKKETDSVLDLAEEASKMLEAIPKRETIVLDHSNFSVPEQKATDTKQEEPCKGLNKAYVAHIREVLRKRKRTEESCPMVGKSQLDDSSEGLNDWIERELESGIIVGSKTGSDKKVEKKTEVMLVDTSRKNDDSWKRKRKRTEESCPMVGKSQLDDSSEGLNDWIERELEAGIIVGSKTGSDKKVEQKTQVILVDTSRKNDDLWIEKELEEGIIIGCKPVDHKKVKSTGESRASFKMEKCGALKAWRELQREREARTNLSSKRQRR